MEWLAALLAVVLIAVLLHNSPSDRQYRPKRSALGRGRTSHGYGEIASWSGFTHAVGLQWWCEDVRGLLRTTPRTGADSVRSAAG